MRTISSASSSALYTASCSTSSGSSLLTRLTASRTSAAARSTSSPGWNSTRMRALFSSLDELMSRTPETRATAPSSRLVTSESIVSGDAPGNCARTLMIGRSTSGSSRTSTASSAPMPAMTISRLMTATSQGRRTPSAGRSFRPEISFALFISGVGLGFRLGTRVPSDGTRIDHAKCNTLAHGLYAFADNHVALGQVSLDKNASVDTLHEAHRHATCLFILCHPHKRAVCAPLYRDFRDGGKASPVQPQGNAKTHPRAQLVAFIGHAGAHTKGARHRIDSRIHLNDLALYGALAVSPGGDGYRIVYGKLSHERLRRIKRYLQRAPVIQRGNDRRGVDAVADLHIRDADVTGKRCVDKTSLKGDLREIALDACGLECRTGAVNGGFGDRQIDAAVGAVIAVEQPLGFLESHTGQFQCQLLIP